MTSAPSPARGPSSGGALLLLVAFFLSGVSGLVHEMVWTRLLRHVMGNTTFAVASVLTVFMAGLALGSLLAGRWIERRRDPVRVFALFEAGIGLSCLLLPAAIDALEPLYRTLYQATSGSFVLLSAVRFLFCSLVLLPTATLMGATLPILVRFFVGTTGAVGGSIGRLYAINTLGAVCGAAGSGFLLLPILGVSHTIWFASGLNLLVATLGLGLHGWFGLLKEQDGERAGVDPSAAIPAAAAGPPRGLRLVLIAYALSGFSALTYEVAWTRVLAAMIGSSVYAFSMMLTAFILGLGLGSLFFARFVDRLRMPLRTLAWLQAGIAASALAVVPLFGHLPIWITGLISRNKTSFWDLHGMEFGLIVAIMLVPTSLMGATFPLVSRLLVDGGRSAARATGVSYSANTLGSILGSAATGFLLVPTIGTQSSVYVAVLINAAVAAAFALLARGWRGPGRVLVVLAPAGFVAGVLLLPRWDPKTMYFGSFYMARSQPEELAQSPQGMLQMVQLDEVLLHEEGIDMTVTVRRNPLGEISLLVNGKPDASSKGDLPTQVLLAHVPLLLHPNPKDVLVVGLASGITLGSAATHPVRRLDCAEISSSVVSACELFAEYNRDVLDDPRVEILVADGRNHLALSGRTYDVIVSEPSNPWIAGVADLFTLEFFELCHEALTEHGVLCVWFERYNMDERSFRSVVRTFREVFPSASLWNPMHADYLLIGSRGELAVDVASLTERLRSPAIAADLARIDVSSVPSFLAFMVTGRAGTERFGSGAPLHTDDNALLEFATPHVLVQNASGSQLFDAIEAEREVDLSFLVGSGPEAQEVRETSGRAIQARGLSTGALRAVELGLLEDAQRGIREAAALYPQDPVVQAQLDTAVGTGQGLMQQGDFQGAQQSYQRCLDLDPTHGGANRGMGMLQLTLARCDLALKYLDVAVQSDPADSEAAAALALVLATHPNAFRRDAARALTLARAATELAPDSPFAVGALGAAHAASVQFAEAVERMTAAIELARAGGNQALLPEFEAMLANYRGGRLYLLPCR